MLLEIEVLAKDASNLKGYWTTAGGRLVVVRAQAAYFEINFVNLNKIVISRNDLTKHNVLTVSRLKQSLGSTLDQVYNMLNCF